MLCNVIEVANSFDPTETSSDSASQHDQIYLRRSKLKERVDAGNTTYTADSHPNSTKP